ncbi:hypothetical protein BU23DRAFT_574200 [Bimuria novae-zelandiae CBS 107.79]|uniref:Uncharacterized protein n=1 Tax=Bimuria novae-zelandiae CBS 107.79 TaxID=1447943 RepID=A0A6A5UTL0_9PLEO|nr:hypothetical protein BU23DRAFT_574200 [Bimuria novae-zelandiae CBS 107.79]
MTWFEVRHDSKHRLFLVKHKGQMPPNVPTLQTTQTGRFKISESSEDRDKNAAPVSSMQSRHLRDSASKKSPDEHRQSQQGPSDAENERQRRTMSSGIFENDHRRTSTCAPRYTTQTLESSSLVQTCQTDINRARENSM